MVKTTAQSEENRPAELEELLQQANTALEKADNRIAKLEAENKELKARLDQRGLTGIEGYRVRTPFPGYSGVSLGIQFRNGQGFVPLEYEGKVKAMVEDFGYFSERTTLGEMEPELAESIKTSLIDTLVLPDRR